MGGSGGTGWCGRVFSSLLCRCSAFSFLFWGCVVDPTTGLVTFGSKGLLVGFCLCALTVRK